MINPLKCPQCFAVPLALLQKDYTLTIECDCGYKGNCSLDELFESKLINDVGKGFTCGNHHHSQKVKKFCINCQVWLCEKCIKEHLKYHNNHKLSEFEIKLNCKCKYHKYREVKYYCEKCQRKICEICKQGLYAFNELDDEQIEIFDNSDENEEENKCDNYDEYIHKFISLEQLKEKNDNIINELYITVFSPERNVQNDDYNLFKLFKLVLDDYDLTQMHTNYYTLNNIIENFDIDKLKDTNLDSCSMIKYSKMCHNIERNYQIRLKEKNQQMIDNNNQIFCMKILKDGRLAITTNLGIVNFYILPEFRKNSEINTKSIISMYYLHELENEMLLIGADSSIFVYEKRDKDYKLMKEIKTDVLINQIISLNEDVFLAISQSNVLFSFDTSFPHSLIFVQCFEQNKQSISNCTFLNLVHKLTESKILLGFSDHITIYNYETKKSEIIFDSASAKSYQSICEYKNDLVIGGMKTISFINKETYQIVFTKMVGFDTFFVKNIGVGTLLIGGDHFFYSFNTLNHKAKKFERNELLNPISLELGNNQILISEHTNFNILKIYEYSIVELE